MTPDWYPAARRSIVDFLVDASLYLVVRWMWRVRSAEKAMRRARNEADR